MADLLIVAAGVPGLITGGFVREGAIVVDIGINAVPAARRLDEARRATSTPRPCCRSSRRVSPVPGGVGPITDVWLLRNALVAARLARGE